MIEIDGISVGVRLDNGIQSDWGNRAGLIERELRLASFIQLVTGVLHRTSVFAQNGPSKSGVIIARAHLDREGPPITEVPNPYHQVLADMVGTTP